MPTEFAAFRLKTMQRADMLSATDILGRVIDYRRQRPVIFLAHIANMHWNLIRVQHWPIKELQLFEPMGKPPARHSKAGNGSAGGISMRYIPQHVVHWLDTCWPLRRHYARAAQARGLCAAVYARDGDSPGGDARDGEARAAGLGGSSRARSGSFSFGAPATSAAAAASSPSSSAAVAPSAASSSRSNDGKGRPSAPPPSAQPSAQPSALPAALPVALPVASNSRVGNGGNGGSAGASSPPLSSSDEPLSWLRRSHSAITSQHQMNGFDCGVKEAQPVSFK
jgi:hypothetical protein